MSTANPQSTRDLWIRRLRQPRIWAPLAAILLIGAGALVFANTRASGSDARQYHQVRRGNMLVSITEGGTLRAANEVSIVSQVEGQSTIIYLIPEGTEVQRGDLLVELDASELEENLTQRQIAYQSALSDYTEARENFAIKKSESDSEIALAELAVEFAKVDQRKYLDGDYPQSERNAAGAIQLAKEEVTRARDRLNHTVELEKRGYATRAELQADELTLTRRTLELEQAEEEERLLTEYEHPRMVRQLESDLEQAEASLARARSRGVAEMSQAEATLEARKATLELEESRLRRVQKQLENTKIHAPQAGLVIYGTNGRDDTPMEEGATVRERQEIIKLPDLSRMVVEVKVHESQVAQVRRGLLAFVTIDSLPDRRFRGRVQRVAVLPDSQSRWLNPDLKVYTTEILVQEALPTVNPGVSARAEIIVSQMEDVLQVPIQAVSTHRGDRVVYRHLGGRTEPVPVQVGMYNDSFVQIQEGLLEGDRILLSPPRRALEEDFLPLMLGDEEEQSEVAEASPETALPEEPEANTGDPAVLREGLDQSDRQDVSAREQRHRHGSAPDGVADARPNRRPAGSD